MADRAQAMAQERAESKAQSQNLRRQFMDSQISALKERRATLKQSLKEAGFAITEKRSLQVFSRGLPAFPMRRICAQKV